MIKGVYHILSNSKTITNQVGKKIYPVLIPQNTGFPAIVINTDSTQPEQHKQSQSSLMVVTLQVEIYVDNYMQSETIADAIRIVLDNYTGTANGENFQRIVFESQSTTPLIEPDIIVCSQRYTVRELK